MGKIHSLQSLGTVDGPGIRFVVFLQGCPLRCACCHNPDTWETAGGQELSATEIVSRVKRYRDYFGKQGGITLSGGEPLLQSAFCREIFSLCRMEGIHTCLDTSGVRLDDTTERLLDVTDHVLLDIKYTNASLYRQYVGCSLDTVLAFLEKLDAKRLPTTLRQVIIPTLNDSVENVNALREIAAAHSCVVGVELLPFRKLCQVKYENLGIPFPLSHLPEPTEECMKALNALLSNPF